MRSGASRKRPEPDARFPHDHTGDDKDYGGRAERLEPHGAPQDERGHGGASTIPLCTLTLGWNMSRHVAATLASSAPSSAAWRTESILLPGAVSTTGVRISTPIQSPSHHTANARPDVTQGVPPVPKRTVTPNARADCRPHRGRNQDDAEHVLQTVSEGVKPEICPCQPSASERACRVAGRDAEGTQRRMA